MARTLGLALLLVSCATAATSRSPNVAHTQELIVTASAYNSLATQTDGDPALAAWGDRLQPGMRAIAVSRDLLPLGLTHGVRVQIDELDGDWVVLDKMASRWQRKIDIYMGEDVGAARRWGRRTVTIRWESAQD